MNYCLKSLTDFERVLAHWRKKGHAHPVFYCLINNSFGGVKTLGCRFSTHSPFYTITYSQLVDSEEHAATVLSDEIINVHGLIRHG